MWTHPVLHPHEPLRNQHRADEGLEKLSVANMTSQLSLSFQHKQCGSAGLKVAVKKMQVSAEDTYSE